MMKLIAAEKTFPTNDKNLGNYGEELVYGMDNILYDTDKIADSMDIRVFKRLISPSLIRVTVSFALLIFICNFPGAMGSLHLSK